MRAGLIGIPGTNKTAVAIQLAQKVEGLEIVDNIPQELSEYLNGVDISHRSNFTVNLLVATEREKQIRHLASQEGINYISCGTLIDSLCYSSAFVGPLAQIAEDNKSNMLVQQLQAEVAGFHALYYLTMANLFRDFDKIFYLPIPPSLDIVLSGRPELPQELRQVDTEMQQVLSRLSAPHVVLSGTVAENVKRILECYSPSSESDAGSSESTSSDSQ
jgi:hypothetical protein